MNENLKDQDVLLVKEKNSDEISAVKGIDSKNGKLDTVSPKKENQQDFFKIDKSGDMLDNFFANFSRQVKDPTHFMFFKVPADKAEETAKNLETALKDSESPLVKPFLDMHKVEIPSKNQKEHAINPDLVNWDELKASGLTREGLEKSGNLEKLLNYKKTDLQKINVMVNGDSTPTDARIFLSKQEDGRFSPKFQLIRHKPDLDSMYFGVKFTDEDKENLLKTGNLGRVIEPEYEKGVKTQVLLSLDKLTNRLEAYKKEWLLAPVTFKGITLSEEQKQKLSNGEKVRVEDMTSKKGGKFSADVQFNASERRFELIFAEKKQSQKQGNTDEEPKKLVIPNKMLGVELTEKQKEDLLAGKTVYLEGVKDKKTEEIKNLYIKPDLKGNKLIFTEFDPDKSKKQNIDGKPVEKKETEETEKQNEKQTKGRKIS